MAREFAKVWFSMLTDDHFTAQPRLDKLLYIALLAQPSLNYAGVTSINFKRLAKACREGAQTPSERELQDALVRMERERFVYTDDETGEALVRAFIRRDEIAKQPNVLLSAQRSLAQIESPKLCAVMLDELERIPVPEITGDKPGAIRLRRQLSETRTDASEHLKLRSEGLSEPFPEPFGEPFREGLSRPGETEPFSEPFPEPFGEPSVVVEVEVAKSPTRDGYVGGSRAREVGDRSQHDPLSDDPPPPRCPRHLNDPTERPCRACGDAREIRAAWDRDRDRAVTEAAVAERKRQAEITRAAIDDCELCNTDGYRPGASMPCSHDPDEDERRARGRALVDAALAESRGKS